jgi:hypothetical protein
VKHFASARFWRYYRTLPIEIQALADRNFALLKANPSHRSLRFKQVGVVWSVRAGFQSRCDSADRNEVLAHIAPNACIDCGPDFKLPLTASASVTALQAGIGRVDSVQWIDERGKSLEQVATRVGAAVGEFIVSAARQCGPPAQPR